MPISHLELSCFTVDRSRWKDLERLFEASGSPHYCWCTAWRQMPRNQIKPDKTAKKALLKCCVEDQTPIGVLGYINSKPVAWCSIAPRETFRKLGGDETKNQVWSFVCFFIKKQYRQQGLTKKLLAAAIQYAKNNGAQYIEAYPVDPDSPSYRFMGIKPMFENAGFQFIKNAGTRRKVMLLEL